MNIDNATIAVLLTAAGAPIGAAAVWAAIDFIKTSPLAGLVNGRERLAAFIGSALLVAFAYFVGLTANPPTQELSILGVVGALLAFYAIGRLAMATHDDVNRYPNSLTGPAQP